MASTEAAACHGILPSGSTACNGKITRRPNAGWDFRCIAALLSLKRFRRRMPKSFSTPRETLSVTSKLAKRTQLHLLCSLDDLQMQHLGLRGSELKVLKDQCKNSTTESGRAERKRVHEADVRSNVGAKDQCMPRGFSFEGFKLS
eukprot:6212770-Pleurochrysis_carterae.AAC.1